MYQTLAEKIEKVLSCTILEKPERAILLHSYLNPGMAERDLENSMMLPEHLIELMIKQGVLFRKKEGKEYSLYPMPIGLMFQKYSNDEEGICATESLKSIDQWIQYPLLRSRSIRMKSSQNTQTVIQWLFELHGINWDKVYCFGDYESFIDAIGINTEQEWIRERTKKKREASVIATQDGKWAQHIHKVSKQELRKCLIEPKDFTDMFIMAFPDIHTTVIGSSEKAVTFIHSATATNTYAEMVERCLVK
jgi:hypothetical protein